MAGWIHGSEPGKHDRSIHSFDQPLLIFSDLPSGRAVQGSSLDVAGNGLTIISDMNDRLTTKFIIVTDRVILVTLDPHRGHPHHHDHRPDGVIVSVVIHTCACRMPSTPSSSFEGLLGRLYTVQPQCENTPLNLRRRGVDLRPQEANGSRRACRLESS